MRKEYVKPVMESEEFVSNEYVAACWTIICTNSPSCGVAEVKTAGDSKPEGYKESNDVEIYAGAIGNSIGCKSQDDLREYVNSFDFILPTTYDVVYRILKAIFGNSITSYHPVSLEKGHDNGAHPNASV